MNSEQIEKTLIKHLIKNTPDHKLREVYLYALFPGGKFFRPKLVWSILRDLNESLYKNSINDLNSAHSFFSSAVEIHHAYTLLHDDLPSMDNDLIRRNKPSTHVAFGEWQALLAGDGLLNLSYQLIAKINNPRTLELIRFFSWSMGPKGLIFGQALDLSCEMTKSFENTLKTHELKTAKLIHSAILGSALLAGEKDSFLEKKLSHFSILLGVNFQFLDDLTELTEKNISPHERSVNPWLSFPEETQKKVLQNLEKFEEVSKKLKLENTNFLVSEYYKKILETLEDNLEILGINIKQDKFLVPLIFRLKTFCNS